MLPGGGERITPRGPDGNKQVPGTDRKHPRPTVLVSSGLFAVVTVAHIIASGTGQAVDILYALPVALLAMSFGLRGG